jgi:hypothetical protein
MIGGAHLSVGHGEGQRQRGWRCLPMREVESGQGATGAWPTAPTGRPSGRGPVGKEKNGRLGKENGGGRDWAKNRSWAHSDGKILF